MAIPVSPRGTLEDLVEAVIDQLAMLSCADRGMLVDASYGLADDPLGAQNARVEIIERIAGSIGARPPR